jgi:fucose permease
LINRVQILFLIQLFPEENQAVMNLHHFFFAAGSLSGPVIMGTVLAKSMPWQWAYLGFGLFVLIALLPSLPEDLFYKGDSG